MNVTLCLWNAWFKYGHQVCDHSQSAAIFRATLVKQNQISRLFKSQDAYCHFDYANIIKLKGFDAISLWLNRVKLSITCNLLTVTNGQKSQMCCCLHALKFTLTTYIQNITRIHQLQPAMLLICLHLCNYLQGFANLSETGCSQHELDCNCLETPGVQLGLRSEGVMQRLRIHQSTHHAFLWDVRASARTYKRHRSWLWTLKLHHF